MYTQCPECQSAFRLTVEALQKAGGQVKCGQCDHVFSSLDHLSENLPEAAGSESIENNERLSSGTEHDDPAEKSKSLLETLEELAGPENVQLEDTGIEWRLITPDGKAQTADQTDEDTQGSLQLGYLDDEHQTTGAEQRRYDDNTPLPDDLEEETPPTDPFGIPQRRSSDQDAEQTNIDTQQADLILGDDQDWADLLDDEDIKGEAQRQLEDGSVILPPLAGEAFSDEEKPATSHIPFEVEEQLAAIHSELTDISSTGALEPAQPEDLDTQFGIQAEALGLDFSSDEETGATPEATPEDDREDNERELPDADYSQQLDENNDELSAQEEAAVVAKLRESTGEFQEQIEVAQRALNTGEIDEYEEHENQQSVLPTSGIGSDGIGVDDVDCVGTPVADILDEADSADTPVANILDEADFADTPLANILDEADSAATPAADILDEHAAEGADEDFWQDLRSGDNDHAVSPAGVTLSQHMIQAGIDPSLLDDLTAEDIVMEGEQVSGLLDEEQQRANEETTARLANQILLNNSWTPDNGQDYSEPHQARSRNFGTVAAVVSLLLLLAAQYMHASRQVLATYGTFNQTLAPLYRALGQPVIPEWDVKGWQFERTTGSTDDNDQVLTIFSQIKNASDRPLPYPLVQVSLTDRWEEIIGSKLIEPGDYLAGDLDPRKLVTPGEAFKAVIAIEGAFPQATGFQLYVCYRVGPERVRCATEDFKNR